MLLRGCVAQSRERGLLASVFHPLGPRDHLWSVPHLDDSLVRDQVQVEHLVAVRAQDDKVGDVVILAIAVEVGNLQTAGTPNPQWWSGKRDGSAIGNVGKQESRLT